MCPAESESPLQNSKSEYRGATSFPSQMALGAVLCVSAVGVLLHLAAGIAPADEQDILLRAAPALDESADAFLRGAESALFLALGTTTRESQKWARELASEFRAPVRRALAEMLAKTADHVRCAEGAAAVLLEQANELKEKFGNELVGKADGAIGVARGKARGALRKILHILQQGKRNLDDSMDRMARLRFRDVVDGIREKWTEAFRQLIGGGADLPQDLFEQPHIKDSSRKSAEWPQDAWQKGVDGLKEKCGGIKAAAMEFISHSKDKAAGMSREALDYFRPRREELGPLWGRLVKAAKEAVGKF